MNNMTIAMVHFAKPVRTTAAASIALLAGAAMLSGCDTEPTRQNVAQHAPVQPLAAQNPAVAASTIAAAKGDDAQTRFTAALALLDQHQVDQAEPALVALVHDFPQLSGPSTELGLLYLRSNRKPQAVQSFEQALHANSENTVALNCLGILYRQNGDFARAEQNYLRAIALKPNDAKAHLNLGILYELSLHRPQDALAQYRESQKYAAQENLMVTAWIKELESPAKVVAIIPASGAMTAAR